LPIAHPISDYDTWKAAFDRDPVQRRQSGVHRYTIHRPVDDPHFVLLDLDFDTQVEAESLLARLLLLWQCPTAAPALAGTPHTRITATTAVTNL
jgi:hypothetical protein